MEKEITKNDIVYVVREMDSWADEMEIVENGISPSLVMKLAVKRKDNEPINWKNVPRKTGSDLYIEALRINASRKKFSDDFRKSIQTLEEEKT